MTIEIKPSHRGRLHRALGVPDGKPIPQADLRKAAGSPDPALRREAVFAENARDWHRHIVRSTIGS